MSLKTYKPYTKSTRTTILVDRKGLWKGKPLKSLTSGKVSSGGRNNLGRITSRSKGSGHKKRYREIDFHRNKLDMKAKVERIEYDPNRTSHIALVKYEDGLRSYIICAKNLKVGDEIISGNKKEIKIGNCMPLSDIPPGTIIHNVELVEGNGGKLARSAGSSVTLSGFDGDTETEEGRKALKAHLRKKMRIKANRSSDDETASITRESKDANISFDTMVPDTRKGAEEGATRRVKVGKEEYRSKGVGLNSVLGGLGVDMQDCLRDEMGIRNK